MVDAILGELRPVVLCLVEADDMRNAEVAEHLQVVFGLVASSVSSDLVNGTHEGYELFR